MLAPAIALGGLTGARIVMVLIAALLADQLFRLLRDLRFRRRYRLLAWSSVVFCLPVLAFANQVYPELAGALLIVISIRIMVAGRPSPAALAVGSASAAALVWLHVRYLSLSLAVLLGLAIVAFSDLRQSAGGPGAGGLQRRVRTVGAAVSEFLRAASKRWHTALLPLLVPYAVGIGLFAIAFQHWYGSPDPRAPYLGWGYTTVGSGGWNFVWRFALTDLLNPVAGWIPYAPVHWVGLAALGCLVVWFRWPAAACIAVAAGNELIIAAAGPSVGWGFPARYLLIVIPLIAIPIALVLQEVRVARAIFFPLLAASLVIAFAFAHDYQRLYPVGDKPRLYGVRSVASIFPVTTQGWPTPTSFALQPGVFPPQTGKVRGKQVIATEGLDPPGYVIFGPYTGLREGEYRARFRMAVAGVRGDVPVATIETSGTPPGTIFARKVVTAAELEQRPTDVQLDFRTPGGWAVETRVFYQGRGTLSAGRTQVEPLHVKARTWAPDWLLVVVWVGGTVLVGWLFVRLLRRHPLAKRA